MYVFTTRTPTDNVPLAAIQGISRLLTELDKIDKEYERELLAISQKIRPFMNTDCAQLRENSIKLFGIIAGRVKSDALVEQGVSSLPCFLLHLCDNNPAVVRVSAKLVDFSFDDKYICIYVKVIDCLIRSELFYPTNVILLFEIKKTGLFSSNHSFLHSAQITDFLFSSRWKKLSLTVVW